MHTPPLSPPHPPWGSSFCYSYQGMICTRASLPSQLGVPGHGRWPQISRCYRAPHAAPPAPSPPPSFSLRLHLHLPCCHRRQNMTARRGQSGHGLRRSRGGNSAQFSWFQGGCVRLFFITACGEVSFTKTGGLRGATLLTCWKNSIFSFLVGVFVIAFSPPSCSAPPFSLPSTYHLSFLLLPSPS